jgi:hypothetical protein
MANRGTGAGGANTTKNGAAFEQATCNRERLMGQGWVREGYYLRKKIDSEREIIFLPQKSLKRYCKEKFNVALFRDPDEAYLFRNQTKYLLKILEKKAQNTEGSVDTKLCADTWFKEEYQECLGPDFTVEYAFCLSAWLRAKYLSDRSKWPMMRRLHARHGTTVLFGEDADYFVKLDDWIKTSFV